ncbi:MAG: Sua5/YciO/YrdC/YwlC family protein [Muribaculaceae bacterium]|nr:Sua5/YciO/YrdC/YwlC family protein [Muribaculaceae bacterium]
MTEDIAAAVECMRRGGVILYPTDTVWGLGCDATRPDAVKRIFEIKQRACGKALIALVSSRGMLERCVDELPEVAWDMMSLSERPLTVVLDGARGLAADMIAPDGSVGMRLTREAYSSGLCRALRRPVVSTSANVSTHPAPAVFSDIDPAILSAVDYVATYRRDDYTRSLPSAVVKIGSDLTVKVLRK